MAGDDSVHVRQALTYVIPTATIVDFYTESHYTPMDVVREFYGEDAVAEVYEQRTYCVIERSTGSGSSASYSMPC